jgi:hypothetical protein
MSDLLNNENYLYKFIPFSINSLKLLIKSELYFGIPLNLNDHFEGEFHLEKFIEYPSMEIMKTIYLDDFKFPKYITDIRLKKFLEDETCFDEDVSNYLNQKLKSEYGVSCFTKSPKEILMWSHYADSFKGMCLIFDRKILMESLSKENVIQIFDINYNNELPKIIPKKHGNSYMFQGLENVFKHKQENWKYENEVRLQTRFSLENTNNTFRFDKSALKGIITGTKMNGDDLTTLVHLIKHDPNYKITWGDMRKKTNKGFLELDYKVVNYAIVKSFNSTKK